MLLTLYVLPIGRIHSCRPLIKRYCHSRYIQLSRCCCCWDCRTWKRRFFSPYWAKGSQRAFLVCHCLERQTNESVDSRLRRVLVPRPFCFLLKITHIIGIIYWHVLVSSKGKLPLLSIEISSFIHNYTWKSYIENGGKQLKWAAVDIPPFWGGVCNSWRRWNCCSRKTKCCCRSDTNSFSHLCTNDFRFFRLAQLRR